MEITLTPEQLQILNKSSALDPALLNGFFSPKLKQMIFGGKTVRGWQ